MGAVRGRDPVEHPGEEHGIPGADRHPDVGRGRDEPRRDRVQDGDRRLDPRVAQLDGLVEGRDAQPVHAGVLQRPRHRDGPVPVRIGLDDGPDRRCPGGTVARMAARLATSASRSISSHAVRGSGGSPAAESRASMGGARPSLRREPEPALGGAALLGGGQALARQRDPVGQVGREEARVAEALADLVARQPVQVHPEPGGGVRVEALGEQRADRPGEHVAGAT